MVSKIHTEAKINFRTVCNTFVNLCVKIIGGGMSTVGGSLVVAPRNGTVLEARFSHTLSSFLQTYTEYGLAPCICDCIALGRLAIESGL